MLALFPPAFYWVMNPLLAAYNKNKEKLVALSRAEMKSRLTIADSKTLDALPSDQYNAEEKQDLRDDSVLSVNGTIDGNLGEKGYKFSKSEELIDAERIAKRKLTAFLVGLNLGSLFLIRRYVFPSAVRNMIRLQRMMK